ncbi:alpha/beta hydrolase family protein [Cryptosporangium sp. NPDC048952]|uniref:alpha/beta hydrolase family protein n=1 Tax=Cryptosporangium sp. NPDC048952 TaxID=3363961 RepID=UPI00371EB014
MSKRLLAVLVALALFAVGAAAPPRFTLPAPTGPYAVGTTSLHLVDVHRADPWVPTDRSRDLIVQLWYPTATVRGYPAVPWLAPAAARAYEKANGLPVFDWPITAGHEGAPVARAPHGWPVLLYSPGLGGHRGEATSLVQGLTANGYLVVTIDHVHDSRVVEMPDGHVEPSRLPALTPANELAVTTKAINSRVADVRFVLDQLIARYRGVIDEHAIGMLGHSDGGATTAAAMDVDRRIAAGVNLDGTLWTPAAQRGSDRPVLLFGRDDQTRTTDPTWAKFWAQHRGPKLQLNLADSGHGTFHDFVVLLRQAAPYLGRTPEELEEPIGTIDGERAVEIERRYVTTFFDQHLRRHPSPLLTGPSPDYPEVTFTP